MKLQSSCTTGLSSQQLIYALLAQIAANLRYHDPEMPGKVMDETPEKYLRPSHKARDSS